jgi:hypothetical protein
VTWRYNSPAERQEAKAALLPFQLNRCAICIWPCELFVDHDHATGLIRGLLCQGCNSTEDRGDRREDWAEYVSDTPASRYHAGREDMTRFFLAKMDRRIGRTRDEIERRWEEFPMRTAASVLPFIRMGADDPRCPTWIRDEWEADVKARHQEAEDRYRATKDVYDGCITVTVNLSESNASRLDQPIDTAALERKLVDSLRANMHDRLLEGAKQSLIPEIADSVALRVPRHRFNGGEDWNGDYCTVEWCGLHWRQHPVVHELEAKVNDLTRQREQLVTDIAAMEKLFAW